MTAFATFTRFKQSRWAVTVIALMVLAGASAAQDSPAQRMTQENLHAIIAETAKNARAEGNVKRIGKLIRPAPVLGPDARRFAPGAG